MVCVSVIVPVFNAEKYLEKCLDSIVCQTLSNIEIICINDGSTDNSRRILDGYKDDRILILEQENKGAGCARNNGIAHAKGEYIVFMDPDDYYADETVLEDLYTAAVENCALICGGNVKRLYEDGQFYDGHKPFTKNGYIKYKEFQDCYYHVRYMFCREMLIKHKIFYPPYIRYQDPPFLVKAMVCAERFYSIDKTIYICRVHFSENKYDACKIKDTLYGIGDVLKISAECGLARLHEKCWNDLLKVYGNYIYYYQFVKKEIGVVNAAVKVDAFIRTEIIRKTYSEASICNINNYYNYTEIYKDKERLDNVISDADTILIYGAGYIGRKVYKYVRRHKPYSCIEIAVTKVEHCEPDMEVRPIDFYLNKRACTTVIVATTDKYQDEIIRNLEILRFKNIYCINAMLFEDYSWT